MNSSNGLELALIKQQIAQLCAFSLGKQKIEELQPSFSPLVIAKENRRIAEALQAVIQFGPVSVRLRNSFRRPIMPAVSAARRDI